VETKEDFLKMFILKRSFAGIDIANRPYRINVYDYDGDDDDDDDSHYTRRPKL
jgi:hypothetical protein